MPIFLASDHNGVMLKSKIKIHLRNRGLSCVDLGPYDDNVKVDYVDYARQLATIVAESDHSIDSGILICGTGVGMSIVANKTPGIRAALVHSRDVADKCREHNDSNVLCLGSWVNTDDENVCLVNIWVNAGFGEHRHVTRIEKINPNPYGEGGLSLTPKIVFTNGCFDILHAGHLHLLKFAKLLGDYLVVGLNTDRTVRELKGVGHPVNPEENRKAVLEAMRDVDEVIVFDEYKPTQIIQTLNPNIVVRGGEYTALEIRERDDIPSHIVVKICPLVNKDKLSTSKIMQQIRSV